MQVISPERGIADAPFFQKLFPAVVFLNPPYTPGNKMIAPAVAYAFEITDSRLPQFHHEIR